MTAPIKRPRSVTITLVGVILLGAWNAAQAVALARQMELLLSLAMRLDPRLLMVLAVLWAVLFWGAAAALFLRRAFTRWFIPLLIVLYALYELGLQGLFASAPVPIQGWLIRILLYDGVIAFAIWSLNRKRARSHLGAAQPAAMIDEKA